MAKPRATQRERSFPPDLAYLMREGHLYAHEAVQFGSPAMTCAFCGEPTDLIWMHEPIADPMHFKGVLPGSVWDKDIAVLCRCCSRAGCPHKGEAPPSALQQKG